MIEVINVPKETLDFPLDFRTTPQTKPVLDVIDSEQTTEAQTFRICRAMDFEHFVQ